MKTETISRWACRVTGAFKGASLKKTWMGLIYLLVGILAYGLLLPQLGFYWDD